jgi:hypothetical protein
MPTKAELQAQLDDRDTEAPTVSTALAAPVVAIGVLMTVAVLYLIAARVGGESGTFSPWWLAVPHVIAGTAFYLAAKTHYPVAMYGRDPRDFGRILSVAGGGCAAAWQVWTGFVGPARSWPELVLGVGTLTALWWASLWWARHCLRPAGPDVVSTGDAIVTDMPWAAILERVDPRTVITSVEYHRAGARLTIEPARWTAADGTVVDEQVTFEEFAACAGRFATSAAREFRRRTGDRLPLNSTRPEVGRDDAEFVLHVTMRDVMSEDVDYVAATEPQTIVEARDLGEYEDATRILISLLSGHAKIVGMTGAGKSVEANNWIGRITECANTLVWVCATDKLIPLIFPWLRSWFDGTSTQPCLDWVAGKHIDRVLRMLAAAYKLCCDRNDRLSDESKMVPTQREPAVFVFVEEVSHATEFGNTVMTHDGQEVGLSDLLMMVARGGRSANVRLVLMAQTALNDALGAAAPEIIRNLAIRVCLRTMESHDGYRTIPALKNVDTTLLPIGQKIVQPSIEQARAMPGKAANLDGTATIYKIAARQAEWRPVGGVERESDLGDDYRNRWKAGRLPELARAVEKAGLRWREPERLFGFGPLGETQDIPVVPGPVPAWVQTPSTDDDPTDPTDDTDIPDQEGTTVDTTAWTEDDDRAVAEYTDAVDPGDDGVPAARRAQPFQLPRGGAGLARLKARAADLEDDPADDAVVADEAPLPDPLDRIIRWLDEQDSAGTTRPFYLTSEIAEGIQHPDARRLGREIFRVCRVQSRNALADEAPGKPKGYDVAALREAATRIRFAL